MTIGKFRFHKASGATGCLPHRARTWLYGLRRGNADYGAA